MVVDNPLEIWSNKSYSRTDDGRTLVLEEEWNTGDEFVVFLNGQ